MYELLLVWFFCIVFFTTSGIALALTRKPLKQAENTDCVDCNETTELPETDFGDIPDSTDDIEDIIRTDLDDIEPDFGDEDMDETPEPIRTGKVTMLAENLAKALNIVKDAVATRTTLPICTKVLIEFKEGTATFRTTNLDTMIVTSCGCKIESEFTCLLPFKILKDLSELLYDDIVTFEQSTTSGETYFYHKSYSNVPTILIKQGRQTVTLFDADPLDYPPVPKVEGQSVVISELSEAIKQVKDRIIAWDTKHYNCGHFAGLYFDLSKLNIVATDGSKMKIAELNCEPKPVQFRIDKECALTLAKMKDMDCIVTSNESGTRFDFGEYVRGEYPSIKISVLTQNLKGEYPDYEALKESHKELVSVC
jgi:DNA polymerase III sliding clamp (beta) subunit (PCNA family)